MFEHAWRNYEKYAWGYDELRPVTKMKMTWMSQDNDLAVTIVDSLDTLYIMGMKDDFQKAVKFIDEELNFDFDGNVSVFETTIRILGGLLSAFELSGDGRLLNKAVKFADHLMPAFDTDSGLPNNFINMQT